MNDFNCFFRGLIEYVVEVVREVEGVKVGV